MTVKEMSQNIDKVGRVDLEGLKVQVMVVDARMSYGQMQYQIQPVSGAGAKWVMADRVYISEDK